MSDKIKEVNNKVENTEAQNKRILIYAERLAAIKKGKAQERSDERR